MKKLRNKSEKVLIVGNPQVRHRFINTDALSNSTLPTTKDVLQRVMHDKAMKTGKNSRKVAEEVRATWIHCNVYPVALPTVAKKILSLIIEFDR